MGVELAFRAPESLIMGMELAFIAVDWLTRLVAIWDPTRLVAIWDPTRLVAMWHPISLVAIWATRLVVAMECIEDMVQDQALQAIVAVMILPARATVLVPVVEWKLHAVRRVAPRPTLPGLTWVTATEPLLPHRSTPMWVRESGTTRRR